ncbi:endonuclease/exonuclease/phosphatase family protein [Luteolibacter flavescens]|uniref:Endonuclease/exonuclease/phosphatase family protein n=1 Tax=Luteolibacter flavescens TaxID=1859460 RepID=A0ABT3FTQ9_9BACT|nr:endonuclease/exonuclease/phosphatase family protein [Luteolibacter flavescens]MCW1886968.1 endonuclease/exonuclease/phosphatase family protein [Luteolibacter flavescens]
MNSSRLRRRSGWTLVGCSLLLHVVTVYAFAEQPDKLAAFTVMPIWVWGGIGLLCSTVAFWFLRAPLSLIVTGIWAMTVLLGADEARVIANVGKSAPTPGPAGDLDGRPLVRVLTLNCNFFQYGAHSAGGGDPSNDIRRWDPDIVLLQEVHPHQVRQIADLLYQGRGDYRIYSSNGVVSRWPIIREVNPKSRGYRIQQVTVRKPDKQDIEVVNIHLRSAATDLRLWKRECWVTHAANRAQRREELAIALSIFAETASGTPAIFGGDFNAPPSDPVLNLLRADFRDSFIEAGTGWGNTYQRRIPVHRIDQIHHTSHFKAMRCRAVTTRRSDHRMVVTDLLPSP